MAKIYTRQGDQGTTALLGGPRLPKSHHRFHAYGTIDELNAHLGLLLYQISEASAPLPLKEELSPIVLRLQADLFVAGGLLACQDPQWLPQLPHLSDKDIEQLEREIDGWDQSLPPLKNFILPGGGPAALQAHVARTVCRRGERWTMAVLQEATDEFQPSYQMVLKYLNRLSDHLFTMSRWINSVHQVPEVLWKPSSLSPLE